MEKATPLRGGALFDGRRCGGRVEFRTSAINIYAAYLGTNASRRRPLRPGFRPGLCRAGRRSRKISLKVNRPRVKGGRHASRLTSVPDGTGGALLNESCCGGRGECHTSPLDMYAKDVGAAAYLGSGFPNAVSRWVRILLYPPYPALSCPTRPYPTISYPIVTHPTHPYPTVLYPSLY